MRLVRQLEYAGCGAACLAMVLGEDYWTARARFNHKRDWNKNGLGEVTLDRQLVRAGYAIERRFPEKGSSWPHVFANVHIALVKTHKEQAKKKVYHFVVITHDGAVYDPEFDETRQIQDYLKVLHIAGLHKLNRAP